MASDKILHDKAFTIAKNLKYHAYQHGLIDMHDVFWLKNFWL